MSKGKAPLLEADISQMPDAPNRGMCHRRAHSEIISLPDDLTSDAAVQSSDDNDNEEEFLSIVLDAEKFGKSEYLQPWNPAQALNSSKDPMAGAVTVAAHGPVGPPTGGKRVGQGSESRKNIDIGSESENSVGDTGISWGAGTSNAGPRHRYSFSLDDTGSDFNATVKEELSSPGSGSAHGPILDRISDPVVGVGTARLQEVGMSAADAKKAMCNTRLAELAFSDPKKAKRIWANRQSAARSKERKVKYIAELEGRANSLQTESTTLSAQLALLQKDTDRLTHENTELRSRAQQMENQMRMQDSLNDTLRMEVNHLKIATGQVSPNSGPAGMIPFGVPHNISLSPQFHGGPRAINQQPGMNPRLMSAQQLQHLQLSQSHQRPHQPLPQQIVMQQQAQVRAMMQQQKAAQAQAHVMMQQQNQPQMRMPSPAQNLIRSQPPVILPQHGQGMMRPHVMMPTSNHHAELHIKPPMAVNKPEVEGNYENFN